MLNEIYHKRTEAVSVTFQNTMQAGMARHYRFGFCMGVLAVSGLVACGSGDPPIYPEKRDITASVYASATVQPDSMYRVHAAVSGILEKNLVSEGDLVEPGTPLLQITDKTSRIQTDNAIGGR